MHRHPFQWCPSCGAAHLQFNEVNRFECASCGFVFFQNTAAACGAILVRPTGAGAGNTARSGSEILLLERGAEPAKGMLDFPGGFIEPGESAESALTREIHEETGLTAERLTYFCSAPNTYAYRAVTYNTCDLIFVGTLPADSGRDSLSLQTGEVGAAHFVSPESIDLSLIAFPSLRWAMDRYLETVLRGGDPARG